MLCGIRSEIKAIFPSCYVDACYNVLISVRHQVTCMSHKEDIMNKHLFKMKLAGAEMYVGDFEDKQDVESQFELEAGELRDAFILLAWYGGGCYDGSAFVLFERGGKLYEVNGGHCSCYGLEGQWDPEETSAEAIVHRITQGHLGQDSYFSDCDFGPDLMKLLKHW